MINVEFVRAERLLNQQDVIIKINMIYFGLWCTCISKENHHSLREMEQSYNKPHLTKRFSDRRLLYFSSNANLSNTKYAHNIAVSGVNMRFTSSLLVGHRLFYIQKH